MRDAPTGEAIEISPDGDRPVAHLVGDFDLATEDMLTEQLASLQNSHPQAVVLDLTATTFLDSTVIGVLIAAHHNGLDLSIRGASGLTRRTLELLAIPEVFPFEE